MSFRRAVHHYVRPSRALAAGALMSFAMLTATAAAPTDSHANPDMFGISMGGEVQYQEDPMRERDLDVMQDVGSRWVRIDITWGVIQGDGPSSYDWSEVDRIVEGITSRGMKVLGSISYTPDWARPAGTDDKYGPTNPAQYASFAGKAAAHYSAMGVHHFEIWNEPNIGFWAPRPDPAAYTALLKAAYPAIKAADPQATVLTGGTAPAATEGGDYSPVDFLKKIYANGGGNSFDAVAHHPYCWPAYPGDKEEWSAWHQMEGTDTSLRSVMIANGDAEKQIWGTEFGAPTNGPPDDRVTEAEQAEMITRAYSLWQSYPWAGPLFTYQGRDLGTDTDNRHHFFGLLRHDFSKKPSYTAYQNAARGVAGSAATSTKVRAKQRRNGRGKIKGKVSLKGASSTAVLGEVELKLRRKSSHGWRSGAKSATVTLNSSGRFRTRLGALRRKLRSGTYRVRARYQGSPEALASASGSRFKLR
jgi:polysaccharide biosynthesis protein PslG